MIAVERGERAAEHVIAAAEYVRALQRPEIVDVLDDADRGRIARVIAAERARVGRIEIAAGGALLERGGGFGQRGGQGFEQCLAFL